MHQPNRLPNLNDSHAVTRGSRLPKQQAKKSLASKPAPSQSTTIGVNHLQNQRVRQLPRHAPAPVWLKSLLAAQKVSMVLFGSVFGLSLIVYGYTMHTQTTWRTQQDQLRRSQNQERQQGVMNEKLKQDLAKRAEAEGSGLVAPEPQMAVFVQSAAPRPPKLPTMAQAPKPIPVSKIPSGY
ncbi:MAG: hypothetical protein LH474_04930 [Chamaesiphon sp.]|nr:hypothetical protein [Chamaesiphon sp.]